MKIQLTSGIPARYPQRKKRLTRTCARSDALHVLEPETIPSSWEAGTIEVAPLAYIARSETLNDAFIILDEAQNTTAEQMKVFLTRLSSARRWSLPVITQIDPVAPPPA